MIPNVAHFVWLGDSIPWIHALAPASAARFGGFERIVVHHEARLDAPSREFLRREVPGLELRAIAAEDLPDGTRSATARANLLRIEILLREGGVYLDMDAIVVRDFGDLLAHGCFCGEESVVFTAAMRRSRSPRRWAGAVARTSVRRVCRWMPNGWRLFRRLSPLYEKAVSNAVLGAVPGHPLLAALSVQAKARAVRPGARPKDLGVRLLQDVVGAFSAEDPAGLSILPEPHFYPLPPDISAHWFSTAPGWDGDLPLTAETRCVHWYASLLPARRYRAVDAAWIERFRDRIPMARLLDGLGLARRPGG